MSNDDASLEKSEGKVKCKNYCNPAGNSCAIYGLGVVGAVFYFVQAANTFGEGVIGVVKAIFWPALLMYELLTYLKL